MPAPPEIDEEERTPPDGIAAPTSIQTVTMADLFVRQGHPEQAIPIYEKLLAAEPGSAVLREKLTSTRAALAGKQLEPTESTPPDADTGAVPPGPAADEATVPPHGPEPLAWSEPAPSPVLTARERLTAALGTVRSRRRAPTSAPALAGRDT